MFQETARGRRDRGAGPAPDRLAGTTHLRGSWRGGGGAVGHRTGVRFRGSQTVFWVQEGGAGAEVSLSPQLDPHLHCERNHTV